MRYASKAVLVGSAFLCAASFSPRWSGGSDISLSVPKAQARVGRPATPVSAAGVARRHARRGTYGRGMYVGAGIAGAAALGTAAALGAASNGYYGGGPYYGGAGYGYAGDPYAAYDYYDGYYVPYGSNYTGCLAAPRVGAFASQPWTDTPTCPGY